MCSAPEEALLSGGGGNADPLENRASVAGHVRQYVDLGVVPSNELTVVPDLLGGFDHVQL